ncbi:nuclear fragile X mental retardation-interacting protein 1 [Colias croceus]|uniref:nuclear fragile X mental retardation-interacting protein 1 n=1 Tax=Colias crocea TaxID=72248 RepID=UPI001E279E7C|nr:nuclear fragile X mental retardation-interacting protein 1 [Colias croceus]
MYWPNDMYPNEKYIPNLRDNRFMNTRPHGSFLNRNVSYNNSSPFGNQSFSDEYWCETCDRGFRTQQILENHKKQHQKCNIDGCQFIAHPKVIIKHVQMQHSTGLYKKIAKLNNPEEIERWREERRKKYPTKSNIEKKNSEIKEKIERGEKMGIGSRNKNKDTQQQMKRKRPFDNHTSRKHNVTKTDILVKTTEKQCVPKKISKIISVAVEERKLKPFPGLQHLLDESNDKETEQVLAPDMIEEDEFVMDDNHENTLTSEPVLCGILTSLINDYGSSDEEDSKTDSTDQVVNKCNQKTLNKKLIAEESTIKNEESQKHDIDEDDSGPEEVKVVKVDISNITTVENIKPQKQPNSKQTHANNHSKKIVKNTFKRKIPSTLLEKLLSNEIRQERNIVLQCIRYIVQNNYFNKKNKK